MIVVFGLIGAATALLASFYWYQSATMKIPDLLNTTLSGAGSLTSILTEQSKVSSKAAAFAGISALAQAVAMLLGLKC